ncbi:hypothetical protein B5X24_HaOG215649 [Helicoverpa armigera]|uniref:Uncharacterized protein n=1 Tax=Helicoverpa armigera TaxID=29058 RepID=A0A2W1AZU3_HELAM|nr:hypothetical protein B5X24_HaOG215649 [Helicoverpa armigera]
MFLKSVFVDIMCFFVVIYCEDIDTEVRIEILKSNPKECKVRPTHNLERGSNFTLLIISQYFIEENTWSLPDPDLKPKRLETLENVEFRSIYEKGFNSQISTFFINHTHKVRKHFHGVWQFSFKIILDKAARYHVFSKANRSSISKCNTTVNLVTPKKSNNKDESVKWELIAVPVIVVVLLAQTVYIICMKYRGQPMKFKRKGNGAKNEHSQASIADRPPQPLPPGAVVKQESTPVRSPEPVRHPYSEATEVQPVKPTNIIRPCLKAQIPTAIPAQVQNSYTHNMCPIPVKNRQGYRNQGFDTTEDIHPHDFVRRHLEARPSAPKMINRHSRSFRELPSAPMHLSPNSSHLVSKSFKEPKPAPRLSPNMSPKVLQLASRQEHVQPSKPKKKLPIYPPPPLPERRISSDDEWQYEELQPAAKYINGGGFL